MREIKFRGKRTDNGEWVYGNLVRMESSEKYGDSTVFSNCWIIEVKELLEMRAFAHGNAVWANNEFIQVVPETVGQYTGRTDSLGYVIFEGDIIKQTYHIETRDYEGVMESRDGDHTGLVVIALNGACIKNPIHYSMDTGEKNVVKMYKPVVGYRSVVIGNIYEHPHLLGGAEMNPLYEAEAAVLGALITNPERMDDCYLDTVEMAADERHALILETLRYNYEEDGNKMDLISIQNRGGSDFYKVGGISYFTKLAMASLSATNFDHYQGFIRKAYIQRRTEEAYEILYNASKLDGGDASALLTKGELLIEEIRELEASQDDVGLRHMGSTLDGHVKDLEERSKKKGMTGSRTISKEIDRITGGHQRGDYEVVAARPSMGKTAELVCDAIQTTKSGGTAAAVFSAEMIEKLITERFICALAHLDNSKMRSGMFDETDWQKYSQARDELDRLPIFITDKPDMTVQFIKSEVKKLKKKHDTIVVYVDYIQIISGGRRFGSKREEVEYVSRQLKLLARTLGVTVVALSQLSRKVEDRQDKRPMMSDLGETGAIERDADIITFLYRDDYYNKESEKKNIVELIIAKGRNVGTGTVEMVFQKNIGKFIDIDRSHHAKTSSTS